MSVLQIVKTITNQKITVNSENNAYLRAGVLVWQRLTKILNEESLLN